MTTSLKLVLKIIHQATVLFWTKGWLLKGKKGIYGAQKKQVRTVWFENTGVCRYREVYVLKLQVYTGTTGGKWAG